MKKTAQFALQLIICLLIYWWIFTRPSFDLKKLFQTFREANVSWLLLAAACYGLICFMGACRWHLLLKGQGLARTLSRSFALCMIGNFFNSFLPGGTGGDLVKAIYATRETHHKKTEAVTTIVIDRLVGLIGLFIVSAVMILTFGRFLLSSQVPPAIRGLTFLILSGAVFGMIFFGIMQISHLPERWSWFKWLLEKAPLHSVLNRMYGAVQAYHDNRSLLFIGLGISVCVHLTASTLGWSIGKAIHLDDVAWWQYVLFVPICNSVAAIPITPGGAGLRENIYMEMFKFAGLNATEAFALSTLTFLCTLLLNSLGGIFFVTYQRKEPIDPKAATETEEDEVKEKEAKK